MLVRQTIDRHITEAVHADQPVQQHMRIQPVQRIMIEMRVRGGTDIHRRDGKVVEVPVPSA